MMGEAEVRQIGGAESSPGTCSAGKRYKVKEFCFDLKKRSDAVKVVITWQLDN
jgi:hypothetical protein